MKILEAINKRRSIRDFSSKPVEQEKLSTIIQSGNLAPVFGEIHFTVIENKNLLQKIAATTVSMMKSSGDEFAVKQASSDGYNPVYNSPIMIVISAKGGNDKMGFNMANVSCAAQNMLLSATDLGLGSCFVMAPLMSFANPEISNQSKIPADYIPLVAVLIGYSDVPMNEREVNSKNNVNYCK